MLRMRSKGRWQAVCCWKLHSAFGSGVLLLGADDYLLYKLPREVDKV